MGSNSDLTGQPAQLKVVFDASQKAEDQQTSQQHKSNTSGQHSRSQTASTQVAQAKSSHPPIQRLMTADAFQEATPGTIFHPRKRIKKIDGPLKKIEQSGMDSILLNELLQAIDGWLKVASEDSTRKPIVEQLRQETLTEIDTIAQSLVSDFDPENPPTRGRSNAFSAEVTGAGKQYGSDFSDFDSKQFRVSGKAPTRHIEEVKRSTLENGSVMYYATGLVTNFKGSAPMVAPYPEPIPLGDWYPKVTHINGMAVAPKSGILSAAALQESVNSALGGKDDVALGQDAVDLLYTYSAQRGNVVFDLIDCIKGKLEIEDEATGKQEEIMLDAVHRKQRVTVSAHSRGTIKTDNAVRSVHDTLTQKLMPEIRSLKLEEAIAYWEINDPGLGLDPETLAELSISGFAAQEAKRQMNEFIQLIYAGNAVQHPSAFIDIKMYVGGLDLVSMFVGTYSDLGRKIDAAIGTGGSKNSKLDSVGSTKGHGFVGNYVPSVGKEIADDLKKR
ncbi:MAG: hypothetical protein AAGA40_05325 [Cyanobacteria bacterium P01_E01_bin.45]